MLFRSPGYEDAGLRALPLNEVSVPERIGILGGTFDPVHTAHIHLAQLAFEQCQLNELIVVPCSQPPHRSSAQASDRQRFEMLSLAVKDLPNTHLCDYEVKKGTTSYTVETLEFLADQYPAAQLVFCMGEDSLGNFMQWHRWQDILSLAHLAVMGRAEQAVPHLASEIEALMVQKAEDLTSNSGQILQLMAADRAVSATEIRQQIKHCANSGQDLKRDQMLANWLDPNVLNYIVDNRVYQ